VIRSTSSLLGTSGNEESSVEGEETEGSEYLDHSSSKASSFICARARKRGEFGATTAEKQALVEFKKHPITEGLPDRRLMIFLFARKLNVERAVLMLTNNLTIRKDLDIPVSISIEQISPKILEAHFMFYVPKAVDKLGRNIQYLILRNVVPGNFTMVEFLTYMFYMSDLSENEHPDCLRKGVVIVEDLEGASMKNVNSNMGSVTSKNGKKVSMQDCFPGRIQAVWVINPPVIVKLLIKFAKFFVKKKLIQRVALLSKPEELLEHIDAENLLEEFGGTKKFQQ